MCSESRCWVLPHTHEGNRVNDGYIKGLTSILILLCVPKHHVEYLQKICSAGKIVLWVKSLPCQHKDLNLGPQHPLGTAVCVCNHRTGSMERHGYTAVHCPDSLAEPMSFWFNDRFYFFLIVLDLGPLHRKTCMCMNPKLL